MEKAPAKKRFIVLVEHRARFGRDYPRLFQRHAISAPDHLQAASNVLAKLQRSAPALADLLVALTVSEVGKGGVKA